MVEALKDRFLINGCFSFSKGDKLNVLIKQSNVPNEPGVYLIFSEQNHQQELIYIGKAGTIKNNGEFSEQKLRGRLKAKQSKKTRQQYFTELVENEKYDNLKIFWFVTFKDNLKFLPSFVENELLQQYFESRLILPKLNKQT